MPTTLPRSLQKLFVNLLFALLILSQPISLFAATSELPFELLFPKYSRVGDIDPDIPVYPVYQLDELLGYAWLSTELSDIPGFAGQPIKLFIGLDVVGKFTDVLVLDHHEPVFLHGLGSQALYDFAAQYKNRSVTDQIIVSDSRAKKTEGPVYFDGVTKATVSVMIVNDVVLSTSLEVARKKLAGFALASPSKLMEKPFQEYGFQALLDKKLIHRWMLTQGEVEAAVGRSLNDYIDFDGVTLDDTSEPFIELYYSNINNENSGRNLLGEKHWSALMGTVNSDEQLIWVGSSGIYSHVSDDFTPGTVPARLSLRQAGLLIEIKDTHATDEEKKIIIKDGPPTAYSHIFRIKGGSGFDIGSEISLLLNINLQLNHLNNSSLSMSSSYQLPESEWVRQEVVDPMAGRKPLWVRIWQDRAVSIGILTMSLMLLFYVFIRQEHFSKDSRNFHYFRWSYLWFTLLFTGFYAQGQLSVVNIFTLLQSMKSGFEISLFLLDPIIFILWCVTFISLFLVGRGLFCGWLCPFGALQEILSWGAKKLKIKQLRIPPALHRKLIKVKYPVLGGLLLISLYDLSLSERLAEVEPFKTSVTLVFVRYWPFVLYAIGLLLAGLYVHKFYCRYLCPLGAGLAALSFFHKYELLKRIPFCGTPCQTCNSRCEIDAIRKDGSVDYNECVQCLECIVVLNSEDQCADKLIKRKKKVSALVYKPNVVVHSGIST